MRSYFHSQLNEVALLRAASECLGRRRGITAEFVSYVAEIDERKAFVRAGYDSMLTFCVGVLDLTEDAAKKYIRAGRTARRFPVLFDALADGRLHMTTVLALANHLNEANADDLVGAAMGKTRAQVEELLAARYPRTEELPLVEAIPDSSCAGQKGAPGPLADQRSAVATRVAACAKVEPIAAKRFALHCSLDDEARSDLSELQDLLSHQLAPGDIGAVIGLALKSLLRDVRKRKLGAADRPQPNPRQTRSARHIPAHVKRMVHARDGGQCTFVSEDGRRCESRRRLEWDHVVEVARGGEATVDNIRLRCRTHNRHAAECAFGAEFMQRKIDEAQRAAAAQATVSALVPALIRLGFRSKEARLAAEHAASAPGATDEAQFRMALAYLRPAMARTLTPGSSTAPCSAYVPRGM